MRKKNTKAFEWVSNDIRDAFERRSEERKPSRRVQFYQKLERKTRKLK